MSVHTYERAYVWACVRMSVHAYVWACIRMSARAYECAYVWACIRMSMHTYEHAYVWASTCSTISHSIISVTSIHNIRNIHSLSLSVQGTHFPLTHPHPHCPSPHRSLVVPAMNLVLILCQLLQHHFDATSITWNQLTITHRMEEGTKN